MGMKHWGGYPASLPDEPLFRGLLEVPRTMRSLLENAFGPVAAPAAQPWAPPVDIGETANALVVLVELPGMKKEDIALSVVDGTLTLRGERKLEQAGAGEVLLRRERAAGPFVRHVPLPATVDPTRVTATYHGGVLRITVPKKEAAKPRTIAIDMN
jgi:HSP20 family protein